jgi:hypothetical protein
MLLLVGSCADANQDPVRLYRAPPLATTVDGVEWRTGNWEPHLPAGEAGTSWGNHRAVVVNDGSPGASAVRVTIPWRRHDVDPASKSIVVVDAETGERVWNVVVERVERASGDVVFQPNQGSSIYHVYYMPWESTGSYYPTVTYPDDLTDPADPAWAADAATTELPRARTVRIESVDDFHSFFPMEITATEAEAAAFLDGAPGGWTVVPEHRDRPVRMRRFIPEHWARQGRSDLFESQVLRDEAFTFQLALVAGNAPLTDVRVSFQGFPAEWQETLTCFNCAGIDRSGVPFEKDVSVPAGEVLPLWIGIRVPTDQDPGTIEGTVTVSARDRGEQSVRVSLVVLDGNAPNGGTDEPDLVTRLAWLDSTAGDDPDFIIEPFEPVELDGHALTILGRRVELAETGLPERILSFFTPELTGFAEQPEPILARPLELILTVGGETEVFASEPFEVGQESRGSANWTAESVSERFRMTVAGRLEYDGMLDYRIALVALADVEVDDVSLPVHYAPDGADYMLGLGRPGGRRPASVDWSWAIENHQEGVWLGAVHKGLQYVLRDNNYARPLNTNFYQNQPLRMPPSWFNDGRGGIRIRETADAVVADNYSGPRTVSAGDTLNFNLRLLITPFKPIDTETHFATRFVHQYVPVDSVRAWGGTVVNIHHANEINPYINYPFFAVDELAAYIGEAHDKGIKVKLYNTIRELTYRAHELFALRSLGDEILNDGEGGGHSWMQEHLVDGYHSAWHAWRVDDAAMLNKGTSRWTNYYIEGLRWLARNQHIDGLYLDDIAFSRETVKRMVTVLREHRDEIVIDLHSANQFNVRDGFINSAMLYMEHFPFLSRLWFGEYFDYGQREDYWMTEVSGLPFGLMGEMLQDGGHPYRGMLYGMTTRKYGNVDPRPVWALMNDFGIERSRMLGYWLEEAPARTNHPDVLATTYVRPDGALIALASWSEEDVVVNLRIDLPALGLEEDVIAFAPGVEGLQAEQSIDLNAVRVPAGQGLFVRIDGATRAN